MTIPSAIQLLANALAALIGTPTVQSGVSSGAGTATITAVVVSKSYVLSKSKGSAGTVAATGTLTPDGGQSGSPGIAGSSGGYFPNYTLSGGTTNLTVKEYSAVLTNSTTVTFDGPVEWQVVGPLL